jgi:hypothetical protein
MHLIMNQIILSSRMINSFSHLLAYVFLRSDSALPEIAKSFGGGVTGSGLEWRFRRIKADAKAIREARAKGIDPVTLDMDGGASKAVEG